MPTAVSVLLGKRILFQETYVWLIIVKSVKMYNTKKNIAINL